MKHILIALLLLLPLTLWAGGSKEAELSPTIQLVGPEEVNIKTVAWNPHTATSKPITIKRLSQAPELNGNVLDRIPEEPLVTELPEIGKYGGELSWFRTYEGPYKRPDYPMYEMMVNPSTPDMAKIYPNVVKSFEADERTITFTLRKGMKWSDGAPFTTEDVMFWWNDIENNTEYTPSPNKDIASIDAVDDQTVIITMKPEADRGDIYVYKFNLFRPPPYAPKHYLKQWHPKYNSEIASGGEWKEAFGEHKLWFGTLNPECPTIAAWMYTGNLNLPIHIWERNPYYWKLDTEGNQLPYIGRIKRIIATQEQQRIISFLAEDVTWSPLSNLGGTTNRDLLKEMDDYILYDAYIPDAKPTVVLYFNYGHPDLNMRALLSNKHFRQAISLSIDRNEINKLVYQGLAPIGQLSIPHGEPWNGEDPMFQRYMEQDIVKANSMLDEIIPERDSDGYRTLKGKKLTLYNIVRTGDAATEIYPEVAEMYKSYVAKVGLRMSNSFKAYSAVEEKRMSMEGWELTTGNLNVGNVHYLRYRSGLFPISPTKERVWGAWSTWLNTNGAKGVEPPPEAKRVYEIYLELKQIPYGPEYWALIREAFDLHTENMFMVSGLCRPDKYATGAIAHKSLKNLVWPGTLFNGWQYLIPMCGLYFE